VRNQILRHRSHGWFTIYWSANQSLHQLLKYESVRWEKTHWKQGQIRRRKQRKWERDREQAVPNGQAAAVALSGRCELEQRRPSKCISHRQLLGSATSQQCASTGNGFTPWLNAFQFSPLTSRNFTTAGDNPLRLTTSNFSPQLNNYGHFFFPMALQPFLGPWPHISVSRSLYTDGRTPWTSDQPVARPLPIHRTTQTQKNAQT
jgi:hypothetical protein